MHFRILLSTLLSFALVGCGSDSKNDYEIYGTWENQSKYFDYQEGLLTVYSLNELHSCYLADYSIIEKISDSHYIELLSNGYSFESQWEITESTLVLKGELGDEIEFNRSRQETDLFDICTSASHPGDINISISFQNLPNTIQVNHEFTPDNHIEYGLSIQFDLNNNSQSDTGDLTFTLTNIKRDSHPESETKLTYLKASLWKKIEVDDRVGVVSIGAVAYSINENTIDIAIYKLAQQEYRVNSEFPVISENVNIRVSSGYTSRNNNSQYDYFPDSGYTSGLDLNYMFDNSDDVYIFRDHSDDIIIDIEEISIAFSN